jgi:hypothetical protein
MKAILYISGVSRTIHGPITYLNGKSQREYTFTWSEAYQKHILNGKEIGIEDNSIILDLATSEEITYQKAVVMLVDEPKEGVEETPKRKKVVKNDS